MKRDTPTAPSGMHPRTSTCCSVPIAPNRKVPTTPRTPKAGDAGAVVPTPADCQPDTKWCHVVDHDGKDASCPMRGIDPNSSSRVPTTTINSATATASVRWRPVPRGATRTRRPKRSRPARRPRSSSSSKSESSLKASPTLPVSWATSACSGSRPGPPRDSAAAFAASSPWWDSRLR